MNRERARGNGGDIRNQSATRLYGREPRLGVRAKVPTVYRCIRIEPDERRIGRQAAEGAFRRTPKQAFPLHQPAGTQAGPGFGRLPGQHGSRCRGLPGQPFRRKCRGRQILPSCIGEGVRVFGKPEVSSRGTRGGLQQAKPPGVRARFREGRRKSSPVSPDFRPCRCRRHKTFESFRHGQLVGSDRKRAKIKPERCPQRIEGGDFRSCKRLRQPVAKRIAERNAGRFQAAARVSDSTAQRQGGLTPRRSRSTEIHQALTVNASVGISATFVGRIEKPLDQLRIRQLAAKELLHQCEPARHHRRSDRRAADFTINPYHRGVVFASGAEVRCQYFLPGSGKAPFGCISATVRERRDFATLAYRHDRDDVASQFADLRWKSGEN